METKAKYEIEISRVHKQSPYNCVGYLMVDAESPDEAINSRAVSEVLEKCNGSKLTAIVSEIRKDETVQLFSYAIFLKRNKKNSVLAA